MFYFKIIIYIYIYICFVFYFYILFYFPTLPMPIIGTHYWYPLLAPIKRRGTEGKGKVARK